MSSTATSVITDYNVRRGGQGWRCLTSPLGFNSNTHPPLNTVLYRCSARWLSCRPIFGPSINSKLPRHRSTFRTPDTASWAQFSHHSLPMVSNTSSTRGVLFFCFVFSRVICHASSGWMDDSPKNSGSLSSQ